MDKNTENSQITIYVAPGYNNCNVYSMPYPMRPGQSPRDLNDRYKDQWTRIGQLDHNLKIRFLDPKFKKFADDIQGMGPLSFFTVNASELDDDPKPTNDSPAMALQAPHENENQDDADDMEPPVTMRI